MHQPIKKQQKIRRSASTCSNHSQTSTTPPNLQQPDIHHPNPPTSNYTHTPTHSVPPAPTPTNPHQKKPDPNPQKPQQHFINIYNQMKKHQIEGRDASVSEINRWREELRIGIKESRELVAWLRDGNVQLRAYLDVVEGNRVGEIGRLRACHQEEIRVLESQINRKTIDLNAHFSRKQQQYKQTIYKFIETLHKSQKHWTKLTTQLSTQVKTAEQALRKRQQIQRKNRRVYDQISSFAQELQNMQDSRRMHRIAQHQQQDSLHSMGSLNLNNIENMNMNMNLNMSNISYDEQKLAPNLCKRNTIDISAIEQVQEVDGVEGVEGVDGVGNGRERLMYGGLGEENQDEFDGSGKPIDRFEDCLVKMIYWGFFSQQNSKNIKHLTQITKTLQNPQSITQQPIFPILLESIKLQLDLDRDQSILSTSNIEPSGQALPLPLGLPQLAPLPLATRCRSESENLAPMLKSSHSMGASTNLNMNVNLLTSNLGNAVKKDRQAARY